MKRPRLFKRGLENLNSERGANRGAVEKSADNVVRTQHITIGSNRREMEDRSTDVHGSTIYRSDHIKIPTATPPPGTPASGWRITLRHQDEEQTFNIHHVPDQESVLRHSTSVEHSLVIRAACFAFEEMENPQDAHATAQRIIGVIKNPRGRGRHSDFRATDKHIGVIRPDDDGMINKHSLKTKGCAGDSRISIWIDRERRAEVKTFIFRTRNL